MVQKILSIPDIYFWYSSQVYAKDLYKMPPKEAICSCRSTLHLSSSAHVFKIWPKMVLAGPYGCVRRSWTTYLKKYFLAWYLKLFIRTHCAMIIAREGPIKIGWKIESSQTCYLLGRPMRNCQCWQCTYILSQFHTRSFIIIVPFNRGGRRFAPAHPIIRRGWRRKMATGKAAWLRITRWSPSRIWWEIQGCQGPFIKDIRTGGGSNQTQYGEFF